MTPIDILNSHIAESIKRALLGQSYVDPEALKIHGFATATMRHLFSNLCHLDDITYLEFGTFCGATFVSAFNNNPIHAVGIDDFTQPFEETGVRQQLADNLNRWKDTAKTVQFFDCNGFDLSTGERGLGAVMPLPIDIYYYDGEHSFDNQVRALPAFFEMMADRFIFIVDDFQWADVEKGTQTGFDALSPRLKIEHEWHLNGERPNDDPIWWNGVAIFLISKVKP